MALFDDLFKGGNIVTTLALGVGAAILLPVVLPVIRPIAKGVMKAGLAVIDTASEAVGQIGQATSDLIAEARLENEASNQLNNNDTQTRREAAASRAEVRHANDPFQKEPTVPDELRSPGTA